MTKCLLSSYMGTTSMGFKDGNGTKVCIAHLTSISSDRLPVFAKDEIVFARTSPKHKLEIGQFFLFHSYIQEIDRDLLSQTRSGVGTYRRGVSKLTTKVTKILIQLIVRVMVSMILLL